MRCLLGFVITVALVSGCTASTETAEGNGDATSPRTQPAAPEAARAEAQDVPAEGEATTAEDQEREAVVAAREAAREAMISSLAPPEPDPQDPGLEETHTGTELVRAISGPEISQENESATRFLPDSSLDVQSVTFPEDGVAWLETCVVNDVEAIATRTGNVVPRRSGTSTQQRTEVMRKAGGTWRLAESFVNSSQEGVVGCATEQPDRGRAGGDFVEDAIVDAREAAEQAWIDAIVDPGGDDPSDTYTGYLLDLFVDPRGRLFEAVHCPFLPLDKDLWPEGKYKTHNDEGGRPDQNCMRRYRLSYAETTLLLRDQGIAFGSGSKSRVVVESIVPQAIDNPVVAYLRTCREHDLKRTDGPGDPSNYVSKATIRSTEAMRFEDDAWKLAARWDFTVKEDVADGCR